MRHSLCLVASVSCISILTACGGGGGGGGDSTTSGGGDTTNHTSKSYETLSSKAEKTSTLGGVAAYINGDEPLKITTSVSGKLTHNNGALTFTSGNHTLTDTDGPTTEYVDGVNGNTNVIFEDQNASDFAIFTDQLYAGDYEYVTSTYHDVSEDEAYRGVAGVITHSSDIPISAKATYRGEAFATYDVTSNQGKNSDHELYDGKSRVDADFGAKSVDVEMTNFKARDSWTEQAIANPKIDTITVTNMRISGNRFSGGAVKTSKNGGNVNLTGANTSSQAAGAFFGYDKANSIPDEVGGVVTVEGDKGYLYGEFVAD